MKTQFRLLRTDKICKAKKKITAAILILAMAVTNIAVSDSSARAMTTGLPVSQCYINSKSGYDAYITFYCPSFNIRDTSGNILFEMVNDTITQQDIERVNYVPTSSLSVEDKATYEKSRSQIIIGDPYSYLPNDLYIKGCKDFIITCTCENSAKTYTPERETYKFYICTSSSPSNPYIAIPNTEISVSSSGISAKSPQTKLQWDKVKEAERYAILAKYQIAPNPNFDGNMVVETGIPFAYIEETNYTVPCNKGKTYQVLAQKMVKGEWRNIRCFEIKILDDEINAEIPITTKLRWNKVKGAKRYAVLEKLHCERSTDGGYVIGGIPFDYTKKTSYTVHNKGGKGYWIWAQKKVKGRWKTIKTIELTLY